MKRKILIATTNPGKYHEIVGEFGDLSVGFSFINLKDVRLDTMNVDEPYSTTWENALHKAKIYAKKSKLITIAEDTAFFVDHLKGAPGIKAKRYGKTAEERNKKILEALKNVSTEKRGAHFETSACLYDPHYDRFTIFKGECSGQIAHRMVRASREGMGYDSIFYYPPAKKTFVEMNILDKNLVSHRGKVIQQLRFFIQRHYGGKQLIVPLAIIVKDRKMILLKRRDTRPAFNNKWEFPGGGVEMGESVDECLTREVHEETGYTVKILERLPTIYSVSRGERNGNYQVFLPVFICSITKGTFATSDAETGGSGWFTYREALRQDLLPMNKKIIQANKTILSRYIN